MPVLFTVGRYDEATPSTLEFHSSLVRESSIAHFEASAHLTKIDEPEEYARQVAALLREVDVR
jgi:proline iminopeptidase